VLFLCICLILWFLSYLRLGFPFSDLSLLSYSSPNTLVDNEQCNIGSFNWVDWRSAIAL
jgi:hypothetical protein